MSYLPSISLLILGLLILGALTIRTFRGVHRFRSVLRTVVHNTNDRTGLVRARAAGLRVAVRQRRKPGRPVAWGVDERGGH